MSDRLTDGMPRRAMVLAAGLGERMRPITNTVPKPLVRIAGRSLLDRALDRLDEAGVAKVVVNAHYLAEMVAQHLRSRRSPEIVLSFEETRLETGGGVAKALPLLGDRPFFVVNSDVLWLDGPRPTLAELASMWDAERMDALLLLHPTATAFGYHGDGDFRLEADGRLVRRPPAESAPHLFAGIEILHPRLFTPCPDGAFSLNVLFDRAVASGRLYGLVHQGSWFHVGTPADLAVAEAELAAELETSHHR